MVLDGRLALVTGGGGGIGRAICQVLARDDARVVVADLTKDSCEQTEKVGSYLMYNVYTGCPKKWGINVLGAFQGVKLAQIKKWKKITPPLKFNFTY